MPQDDEEDNDHNDDDDDKGDDDDDDGDDVIKMLELDVAKEMEGGFRGIVNRPIGPRRAGGTN